MLFSSEDKKELRVWLTKSDHSAKNTWRSLLIDQYETDDFTYDKMEQKSALQRLQFEVRVLQWAQ